MTNEDSEQSTTRETDSTRDAFKATLPEGLSNLFRRRVLRAAGAVSAVAISVWTAGCSLVLPEQSTPPEKTSTPSGETATGTKTPTGTKTATEEKTPTPTPQPLPGQTLVFAKEFTSESGETYAKGEPVTVDKLTVPDAALVFPQNAQNRENQIILHKLEPDKITPPTKTEWTDQGFVAYSAICTHRGCLVEWSEKPHNVGQNHDHCPCHVAEFDPYEGAKVLAGPAPSPLPQIGVKVDENDEVVLTSNFEGGA